MKDGRLTDAAMSAAVVADLADKQLEKSFIRLENHSYLKRGNKKNPAILSNLKRLHNFSNDIQWFLNM